MNPEDKTDILFIDEEMLKAEGNLPMLPGISPSEAAAYAPLTLAFVGDAVYELLVRTAKSHTMAKNATVADYRRATGFEALVGYLYLSGQMRRLVEIVRIGITYERENR